MAVQELTDCVLCTKHVTQDAGRGQAGQRANILLQPFQPAGVSIVENAFPRLASAAGNELCRRRRWRSGTASKRNPAVHGNSRFIRGIRVHSCSPECDSRSMMSFLAELDRSNVVDVDLGSAAKATL